MNQGLFQMKCFMISIFILLTLMPMTAMGQPPTPVGAVPNSRQVEWYHRDRMAFFHFNMNTFTNVEWGTGKENPTQFNPTALDCEQWIRTIKKAGFTTAILTAKHHDGFCIWPSAYTTHDVALSNWMGGKGDVVKLFTDACKKYGVKAGMYLSPWDLKESQPGGIYGTPSYNDYYVNQIVELLGNYGDIWEMWCINLKWIYLAQKRRNY